MTNLASERYTRKVGDQMPAKLQFGVDGGAAKIWEGAMVSLLTATGMAVRAGTASSGYCVGVAEATVEAGSSDGDKSINVLQGAFWFGNSSAGDEVTAASFGKNCYIVDDQTVADNSNGGAREIAGVVLALDAQLGVLVLISAVLNSFGDVAETDNEADIDALEVDAATVNSIVHIPLTTFLDADGDPLAKFVSAGSPTFGFNLADSEALNLRWNNDATPGTALCQIALPPDLDDTADMQLEFLCSKSGATVGDATTLTITAFLIAEGDLHDADANAGGVTNALVGNAAAKTTDVLSLTITAANVPAGARSMTFTVTPTAGTLGTDDLMIHDVRIRYKRKIQVA